jgi:hypothetical protein
MKNPFTLDDLKQAIETAFVHCKSVGMAIFVPDEVAETFKASTDHGGSDGEGRSIRYLEWTYDPVKKLFCFLAKLTMPWKGDFHAFLMR